MSVRNAMLIFLNAGPDHGFSLKKRFEESTAELWSLNVGQVYSTLQRLERDGLIQPSEDDLNDESDAPAQRRYEITSAGKAQVDSLLQSARDRAVPDRDDLVIKFAALAAVHHPALHSLIDAQRNATTSALQQFTRIKSSLNANDIAQLLSIDAVIFQVEAELRWLNHVQARIESQVPHDK